MKKFPIAFLIFFLCAFPALGKGAISVTDPWVRGVPPGSSVTAAYMVIENSSDAADELVGISCGCAAEASLHVTSTEGDSVGMSKVASIEIPAGGSAALSPGGHHVMLSGLSGDMQQSVALELRFRSGVAVSVKAPVVLPGAGSDDHDGHDHH